MIFCIVRRTSLICFLFLIFVLYCEKAIFASEYKTEELACGISISYPNNWSRLSPEETSRLAEMGSALSKDDSQKEILLALNYYSSDKNDPAALFRMTLYSGDPGFTQDMLGALTKEDLKEIQPIFKQQFDDLRKITKGEVDTQKMSLSVGVVSEFKALIVQRLIKYPHKMSESFLYTIPFVDKKIMINIAYDATHREIYPIVDSIIKSITFNSVMSEELMNYHKNTVKNLLN